MNLNIKLIQKLLQTFSENNPQRSDKTNQEKNLFFFFKVEVGQKALEKQSQQHRSCTLLLLQKEQAGKDVMMFNKKKKTSQTGILTSRER